MDAALHDEEVRVKCGRLQDGQRGRHRRVGRPAHGDRTIRRAPSAVAVARRPPRRRRRAPRSGPPADGPWPGRRGPAGRRGRRARAARRRTRSPSPAARAPGGRCAARARGTAPRTPSRRSRAARRPGTARARASRNEVKCAGPSTSITVPVARGRVDRQQQVRARGVRAPRRRPSAVRRSPRARRAPPSPAPTRAGSRRALATRSSPTWPCSHSQSNVRRSSATPSSAAARAKAACVSSGVTHGSYPPAATAYHASGDARRRRVLRARRSAAPGGRDVRDRDRRVAAEGCDALEARRSGSCASTSVASSSGSGG